MRFRGLRQRERRVNDRSDLTALDQQPDFLTVRMILEKVKENGFVFLRSHATLNYYTEKLLFDLHTFEKVSRWRGQPA